MGNSALEANTQHTFFLFIEIKIFSVDEFVVGTSVPPCHIIALFVLTTNQYSFTYLNCIETLLICLNSNIKELKQVDLVLLICWRHCR